jgi:hypothetical protein
LRHARFAIAAVVALAALVVVGAATAGTTTHTIVSRGTFAVPNAPAPVAGDQSTLELNPTGMDADPGSGGATVLRGNTTVDTHGRHGGGGGGTPDPALGSSFDGLNFFDQRFANGGNQFSVEPPDQGLCVGQGKVVEIVNDVYQVFDTKGNALINPVDLNTLYHYPEAINRGTGVFGPDVFDPSCLYDAATGTFFIVTSTLDETTSGSLTGTSHVDIAVAKDPTKSVSVYSIDTPRNPTNCFNDAAQTVSGPCFPDFPHIGADANGFYVTTNVFDFFGPNYEGVNIYALPKAVLASGSLSVPLTVVGTNGVGPAADGGQLFSAIPAVSPGTDQFAAGDGGTEYFVSSRAVFTADGTSSSLDVVRLANTHSLSATPSLNLSSSTLAVGEYGAPAPPTQQVGSTPLADCIGSPMKIPATGVQCWQAVALFPKKTRVSENVLDGNDSRVGAVSYAGGKVWATLGSAATDSTGNPADGVAWFVISPGSSTPSLANQGLLVKDGANLTYPSLAVTTDARAALSFTIVGANDYPSAGYAGLSAKSGAGGVKYAAHGAGPQDGFSEYRPFFANGSPRPRWGDYGAAAADGSSIWAASEYIGQTCTFEQYLLASPTNRSAFGTCGDTRGALGNWDTRISQLIP